MHWTNKKCTHTNCIPTQHTQWLSNRARTNAETNKKKAAHTERAERSNKLRVKIYWTTFWLHDFHHIHKSITYILQFIFSLLPVVVSRAIRSFSPHKFSVFNASFWQLMRQKSVTHDQVLCSTPIIDRIEMHLARARCLQRSSCKRRFCHRHKTPHIGRLPLNASSGAAAFCSARTAEQRLWR